MIKAVLFDFNGTLIVDGDIHHECWYQMVKELTGDNFDPSVIKHTTAASRQFDFAKWYLESCGVEATEERTNKLVETKCSLYNQLIIENDRTQLMNGAVEFLNYLKENNIPRVLVTMSVEKNTKFYFDTYNLSKWFNFDETIYDNGKYSDKAEMYKDAAEQLGLELKDCLVIEDSSRPMNEAISMGCKNIIYMRQHKQLDMPEIKQKVNDFTEIDYSILK